VNDERRKGERDAFSRSRAENKRVPFFSEIAAERELHLPRTARGRELSESRVHLLALRIEPGGRVQRQELRVVECVVKLPPELQTQPTRALGSS